MKGEFHMDNEENLADFNEDWQAFVERTLEEMGGGEAEDTPPHERAPGASWGGGAEGSLPCLYIHNVTNQAEKPSAKLAEMSSKWKGKQALPVADRNRQCGDIQPREKKAANMLFLNAAELLQRGVERCAFVTITTPQNLSYWEKDGWAAARALFRSWVGHKTGLSYVFGENRNWCRVIEPQRRGAIHWHMLVDLGPGVDIRTGVDFAAFKARDYRSAPPALRGLWARMRKSAKAYGLGRVEIMPVHCDKWEACARYVGKYISKAIHREVFENVCDNKAKPLHARRVGFSQGWKVANTNYSWLEHGEEWRRGVQLLAVACGAESYAELKQILGPRWAWTNRDRIHNPEEYMEYSEESPF